METNSRYKSYKFFLDRWQKLSVEFHLQDPIYAVESSEITYLTDREVDLLSGGIAINPVFRTEVYFKERTTKTMSLDDITYRVEQGEVLDPMVVSAFQDYKNDQYTITNI